jgi:hypothetical protein
MVIDLLIVNYVFQKDEKHLQTIYSLVEISSIFTGARMLIIHDHVY